MRFLVDRCAGRGLAHWLADHGHDVWEAWERDPDPGDLALLRWAVQERRVVITIDSDFGFLVFKRGASCKTVGLPQTKIGIVRNSELLNRNISADAAVFAV